MRQLLPLAVVASFVITSAASAASSHLSPAAYTAITRMYALAGQADVSPDGAPADAGTALRRAVCDRLPRAHGDRQVELILDDCAATAQAIGPMTAALACTSPDCIRSPAAAVVRAVARSHRAEARLASTVSGTCHRVLGSDARATARMGRAWREVLRAARHGSQQEVIAAIFRVVDADIAGEGVHRRLKACAPSGPDRLA
jgi:hypothetical protein